MVMVASVKFSAPLVSGMVFFSTDQTVEKIIIGAIIAAAMIVHKTNVFFIHSSFCGKHRRCNM